MSDTLNPTPQLNGVAEISASNAIEIPYGVFEHSIESWFIHNATSASPISAVTLKVQGSLRDDGKNRVVNVGGSVLAIGSTPENVANGLFYYRINDIDYSKAAVVAGTAFTSAHVVTASKFGAINIYIDTTGVISSLSAQLGQDQTVALASDTAAAAITIAELIPTPSNNLLIGYVLIEANGGGWTAITDDLTDLSGLTTATFVSVSPTYDDIVTHVFSAEDLIQLRTTFTLSNTWYRYMSFFLSVLTGTGKVYAQQIPIKHKSKG